MDAFDAAPPTLPDDLEAMIRARVDAGVFGNRDEVIRAALRAFAAAGDDPPPSGSDAIIEGISDGFFAVDFHWRISTFNRAAEEFFKRPRADVIGRVLWDAMPSFAGTAFEQRYRAVMENRQPDAFEHRSVIWPGRWVDIRAFPTRDGLGVAFRDITCRKTAEEEARRRDLRNEALVAATAAIVWRAPADGTFSGPQPSWTAYTGQQEGEYAGWGWLGAVHPTDREATRAAWEAAVRDRRPYEIEHRLRGADGVWRPMLARGVPLVSPDGVLEEWIGIHTDLSALKKVEAHQRLLINELNHRVKNTLATVQSVAQQTLRAAATLDEAREAFSARLIALARAHDILTRENWDGADLGAVVDCVVEPYDSGRGRFTLQGPKLRLAPKPALSFAMALHELATNAVKYGALSCDGGRVAVEWSVKPGEPPRLRLVWSETDGPPVRVPTRRGFGSKLIERGLVAEIDGSADLRFEPSGVVCVIDAALATVSLPASL